MFLRFEENPNCGFVDDRVWKHQGEPRTVAAVLRVRPASLSSRGLRDEKLGETHQREDLDLWCPVTGLNEKGEPIPALGVKVEDSGEGTCWLIYGGLWGLRLKDPANLRPWSLEDAAQWAEPFLLLPADGADVRFA